MATPNFTNLASTANPNAGANVYFLDSQLNTKEGNENLAKILQNLAQPNLQSQQPSVQFIGPSSTQTTVQPIPSGPHPISINPPQLAGQFPKPIFVNLGQSGNQVITLPGITNGYGMTPMKPANNPLMECTSAGPDQTTICVSRPAQEIKPGQTFQVQAGVPTPQPVTPPTALQALNPNGMSGWYPAMNVVKTRMPEKEFYKLVNWPTAGQIAGNQEIVKTEVPKVQAAYPWSGISTEQGQSTEYGCSAGNTNITPKKVAKTKMSIVTYKAILRTLRHTRSIGSLLTFSGALTIGFGIAGIIFYHLGKSNPSNLTWCYDAHAAQNSVGLTQAVLPSSPSINYATSGAGFLGITTFIVGAMTMFLFKLYGTLPNAAMYMSFITIGAMPLMAILAILSFIMTFPTTGTPRCLPLTIINAGVIIFSIIPVVLLFTIYYQMKKLFERIREDPTVTRSSIEKFQSSIKNVRDVADEVHKGYACACECCPCCAGRTNPDGCCPGCCGNDVDDVEKLYVPEPEEKPKMSACKVPKGGGGCGGGCGGGGGGGCSSGGCGGCGGATQYPFANGNHIWKQVGGPTGYYGNSIYNPYALSK